MKKRESSAFANILLALGVGAVSGFLTMGAARVYRLLNLPSFAPAPGVFPIVWLILYTLMGISMSMVYGSGPDDERMARTVYAIQLLFNFAWPIAFFNFHAYLFALIWLLALWMLIIWMIVLFYRINKTAAYLQVPYLIWTTFAVYLNYSVYMLNRV
jgi:tryptophan-rich sensory protein